MIDLGPRCVEVLDAIVGTYEGNGWDLPPRRLVTLGPPAWDCELLSVWSERAFPHAGDVAAEALGGRVLLVGAQFRVALIRCVPTVDDDGNPPEATLEQQAALDIYEDPGRIWTAVRSMLGPCSRAAYQEWLSQGPEGGLGGGILSFLAPVD